MNEASLALIRVVAEKKFEPVRLRLRSLCRLHLFVRPLLSGEIENVLSQLRIGKRAKPKVLSSLRYELAGVAGGD
jgi:hypothetical protein